MNVGVVCCSFGPSPPSAGPPSAGQPKISLFFFPSLGVFSLNFLVFLKARDSNVRVWAPGLSCEIPSASGPPGLTQQPENSKHAHLRAPALQAPPKFHEKTPRDRQKERKWGGRGKKREILGTPPFVAPPFVAPPFGVPPFVMTGLAKKMHWSNQDGQNGIAQSRSLPFRQGHQRQSWRLWWHVEEVARQPKTLSSCL